MLAQRRRKKGLKVPKCSHFQILRSLCIIIEKINRKKKTYFGIRPWFQEESLINFNEAAKLAQMAN